jgi:hypothetical protein
MYESGTLRQTGVAGEPIDVMIPFCSLMAFPASAGTTNQIALALVGIDKLAAAIEVEDRYGDLSQRSRAL